LASRADTPMRSDPVTSFNSAQRPVASSRSSQPARSAPTSARLAGRKVETISESKSAAPPPASRDGVGPSPQGREGEGSGQIRDTGSARSPTKSSDQAKSSG